MAKKKQTTKKDPVKEAIPEQFVEIADALRALTASQGWKLLVQTIEANVAILEGQIISKRERDTGRVLNEDEVDDLRVKHGYLSELLVMPTKMAEQVTSDNGSDAEDFDPFFKSVKEMKEPT